MENDPKLDLAIAGGAIALALIDTLTRKGILERGDGLAILETAQKRCLVTAPNTRAALVCGNAYNELRNG